MKKIIIIYESFFNNTQKIAEAISKGFTNQIVQCVKVENADISMLQGIDLLVVGSPTRGFRPTNGTINFLKSIPAGYLNNIKVAAFDSRSSQKAVKSGILRFLVKTMGYAAKPIANDLIKKGGTLIMEPTGFTVDDIKGPLSEGEIERATKFGADLLTKLS